VDHVLAQSEPFLRTRGYPIDSFGHQPPLDKVMEVQAELAEFGGQVGVNILVRSTEGVS
jgi:hypothetical protein